jgi:hypothetical protein
MPVRYLLADSVPIVYSSLKFHFFRNKKEEKIRIMYVKVKPKNLLRHSTPHLRILKGIKNHAAP